MGDSEYGWLDAWINVFDDYDAYAVDVFIEAEEYCNTSRLYADEDFYELSCGLLEFSSHTNVDSVSVQTPYGDLRCARNDLSDELLSMFACIFR